MSKNLCVYLFVTALTDRVIFSFSFFFFCSLTAFNNADNPCFHAEGLVRMADGTFLKVSQVCIFFFGRCMYVCTYVCMYVCMYVSMHVCVHACVFVCMYVCMHEYMYVCMYACMHACMYVCMYVCM